MAGFKTRALSAVVLVAVLGSALYFGGYYLWGLLLFSSEVGIFEFFRAMRPQDAREKMKPDIIESVGYIGTAAYYIVMLFIPEEKYMFLTLIDVLILLMIIYVFTFPRFGTTKMMQSFFGLIYVGVMLSFVYMTRIADHGEHLVWLIFISSWVCDTAAYLSGMAFGKHKLVPLLSPKKSVEGAVGGVLGSVLIGLLFGMFVGSHGPQYAIICGCGAVISQFGDLTASAIKRNHDIKDYGKLIPGHGGILDRFDSVIITAPVIYLLVQIILLNKR